MPSMADLRQAEQRRKQQSKRPAPKAPTAKKKLHPKANIPQYAWSSLPASYRAQDTNPYQGYNATREWLRNQIPYKFYVPKLNFRPTTLSNYQYELEGTEPMVGGAPYDISGPGPSAIPLAPGQEWTYRWYDAPGGGGSWGWELSETSGGSSGGGGGGGGGGGSEEEVPSALGELKWWGADQISPTLSPWTEYLRELVNANLSAPPSFIFDGLEGEAGEGGTPGATESYVVRGGDTLSGIAARYNLTVKQLMDANPDLTNPNLIRIGQTLNIPIPGSESGEKKEGEEPETSSQMTDTQVLQTVKEKLGLNWTEETTDTQKWQMFIDALGRNDLDLQTQQMLMGLRFNPDTGWYTVQTEQLQNPEYT
jgi:LysM repeat protein